MAIAHAAATIAFLGVPFALSATTAMVGGWLRRRRDAVLPTTAGEWLTDQVASHPGLTAGVSPELAQDADGYWPHARTITLSHGVWVGLDADAHAVAAHELGHAQEHRIRPAGSARLALARRGQPVATQLVAAAALVGALYGAPGLGVLAGVALAVAALLGGATLVEESLATRHALATVDNAGWNGTATRRARLSLVGAWSVYAAEWIGRVALLVAWPWVGPLLMTGEPTTLTVDVALLGWAVLLLTPVLALHAGATLVGAFRPPVVDSEFRLAWTSQRDATWEFHAALVILLWATLAALHPWSRPFAPLVVLAAVPAMGPLAHLARGMALVPVIALWALGEHAGVWGAANRPTRGRAPRPISATTLAVTELDGLSRLGRVLRIAYLPLAVVWLAGFAS